MNSLILLTYMCHQINQDKNKNYILPQQLNNLYPDLSITEKEPITFNTKACLPQICMVEMEHQLR